MRTSTSSYSVLWKSQPDVFPPIGNRWNSYSV